MLLSYGGSNVDMDKVCSEVLTIEHINIGIVLTHDVNSHCPAGLALPKVSEIQAKANNRSVLHMGLITFNWHIHLGRFDPSNTVCFVGLLILESF